MQLLLLSNLPRTLWIMGECIKRAINGMMQYLAEDRFNVDQLQLDLEEYRESDLRLTDVE
jgi:hypothetical protein